MQRNPKVDEIITKYVTNGYSDSPGCALAVAQAGQIIYSRGYGTADRDHGIPNTPSTVFHVASLAKQFTAMAILLISDEIQSGQKLIKLDDDVRTYIGELDKNAIP